MLEDVLYVPDLAQNLPSVFNLQKSGFSVLFCGDGKHMSCQVLHHNEVICSVPQYAGMWMLGSHQAVPIVAVPIVRAWTAITLNDLHHRLGHASQAKLLHMLDKGQLQGVTVVGPRSLTNCYGCIMGKQHRHDLVTDRDKPVTSKLDLIHMDVMGPFRTATHGGHLYVLTIIDDNSRYCWLFVLHKKSDVFDHFVTWMKATEREMNRTLSPIRVDNGGEFQNSRMSRLCADRGYQQKFTNSYTPQQNGVAERYNRTLLDTARSLLAASNLGVTWWGEAAQCANYMRNRASHSSVRKQMSPYQKWTGRRPAVDRMHIFGCRAAVMKVPPKQTKLDNKGIEGVFLGYSSSSTGYRVPLHIGTIVESSDVLFLDSTVLQRNFEHFYPTKPF